MTGRRLIQCGVGGYVRAQAERSTPEVSNEPQAGGLMAKWNARPTMCVYRVHM